MGRPPNSGGSVFRFTPAEVRNFEFDRVFQVFFFFFLKQFQVFSLLRWLWFLDVWWSSDGNHYVLHFVCVLNFLWSDVENTWCQSWYWRFLMIFVRILICRIPWWISVFNTCANQRLENHVEDSIVFNQCSVNLWLYLLMLYF